MWMLLLLACRDPVAGRLDGVEVEPAEHAPAVQHVRWSGPPGRAFVVLGEDGERSTPPVVAHDGEAEVAVLGLKAGSSVTARAVTLTFDGQRHESEPFTLEVPLPPPHMPRLDVFTTDEAPREGYLLTSLLQSEADGLVVILDLDGDPVWWFTLPEWFAVMSQRVSLDGEDLLILLSGRSDSQQSGVWRVSLDGRSAARREALRFHHDFLEEPDGALTWLSYTETPFPFEGEAHTLISDRLLTQGEGEASPRVAFDYTEDYPHAPYRTCPHFDEGTFSLDGLDWTHTNSLVAMGGGRVLMGSRNLDALLLVDPAERALIWQLGGVDADLVAEGGAGWSHAHFSEAWDGGALLFDNGDHDDPPASGVVELAWDVDAGTFEEVWRHPHPEGDHVVALGDARRVGEDVLVAWSTLGHVQLLGRDGAPKWELYTGLGTLVGRARWLSDLYAPTPG